MEDEIKFLRDMLKDRNERIKDLEARISFLETKLPRASIDHIPLPHESWIDHVEKKGT